MTSRTGSVFIAAISSDIGSALAGLYADRGVHVVGTYRNSEHVKALSGRPEIDLFQCNISIQAERDAAIRQFGSLRRPWDMFIGAVGQLAPIGRFFDCDIDAWNASVDANALAQLRLLHALYPYRSIGNTAKVVFLVGGGISGAFNRYSAYTLGKVMLVKFCELINSEYSDVHAVAIGTGWVKTKIHEQTMAAAERAGDNLRRTGDFLASGEQGTTYKDIYDCIEWSFRQSREVTGGRNLAVVHDAWRDGGEVLANELLLDTNKFKLRRYVR